MSIFGTRSRVDYSVTVENYKGFVDPSLAGIQTINAEAALEAYQLNASLYISDVIMEEAVIEGAAEPEVLLEGVVKGSLTKLKEMFQRFWAKVRAWFEKAKRALQMIFSSGEAFIKKFEEDLNMKNVKGFTYEGYHYTLQDGANTVQEKVDEAKKFLHETVGFNFKEAQQTMYGQKEILGKRERNGEYNTSEEKEKLIKRLGAEELSEVLDEVKKAFRNGKDEKEEIEDFSGNSKQELIAIVKNMKKNISEVEKQQRDTDNNFKKVLNAIQNAQSEIQRETASGDEVAAQRKAKLLTFANHKFQLAHYALSIINSLYGVEVDAYKEAAREAESVLKAYLRFKPAKEGFEIMDDEQTGSILESAMKFI